MATVSPHTVHMVNKAAAAAGDPWRSSHHRQRYCLPACLGAFKKTTACITHKRRIPLAYCMSKAQLPSPPSKATNWDLSPTRHKSYSSTITASTSTASAPPCPCPHGIHTHTHTKNSAARVACTQTRSIYRRHRLSLSLAPSSLLNLCPIPVRALQPLHSDTPASPLSERRVRPSSKGRVLLPAPIYQQRAPIISTCPRPFPGRSSSAPPPTALYSRPHGA